MRRIPQRAPKKASKTVYLISGPMQTSLSWVSSFFLSMTNTRYVRPRTLWRAQHVWQIWPRWGLSQSQLSPGKTSFYYDVTKYFCHLKFEIILPFCPTSSNTPMPRTDVLRGSPQTEVKQGFSLHIAPHQTRDGAFDTWEIIEMGNFSGSSSRRTANGNSGDFKC